MVVPWLHTTGNKLYTISNQSIKWQGAAFGDLSFGNPPRTAWQGGGPIGPRVHQYINLTGGKANVIRCALDGYFYNKPAAVAAAVDDLVNECVSHNLYVVLDFHGWANCSVLRTNHQPWLDWHAWQANRYKNIPNVAHELYNEPWISELGGYDKYISMLYDGVKTIRAIRPEAIIIASSPGWNQVDNRWLSSSLGTNIIYSWDHYYKDYGGIDSECRKAYEAGNYTRGRQLMKEIMDEDALIQANTVPVINSEFGFKIGESYQIIERAIYDYIDLMNQSAMVGWLDWMWWDSDNYGLCAPGFGSLKVPMGTVMVSLLNTGGGPVPTTYRLNVSSVIPASGAPFNMVKL